MAKLLKLRRGTTSQHGSFTGAEGEVTVDTTKDTLVVHDGSTAGGHELLREDMSNLPAGTIDNADVNASAAISGTKISPDFGSQTITTTGITNLSGELRANGNINITNSGPKITFTDSQDNPDYEIGNLNGVLRIRDTTNSDNRIVVNTDGHIDIDGNVDFGAGIDVTGNITVTGTVDGRDVAADGSKLDGIETAATADQTAAEIRTLVESASDSNVFTDADHSKLNGIESGATADQTKSDIDGLNINADQVDGLHAASFLRADGNDEATGQIRLSYNNAYPLLIDNSSNAKMSLQGTSDPYIQFKEGTTDKAYIQWNSGGWFQLTNQETSESLRIKSGNNGLVFFEGGGEYKVFHAGNDGSGSGLDADSLDGVEGAHFLRSNTGDTASGDITFTGGAGAVFVEAGSDIRINGGTWTGEYTTGIKLQPDGNNSYFQYEGNTYFRNTGGNNRLTLDQSGNLTAVGNVTAYSDARLKTDIHTINDALGICGKLRGVSYKWLENGEAGIGVIAQEVEEVIPSVVLTNVDTDPATGETTEVKSVDYGKIVGVLINAINELKAEVDELKGGK